MAKASKASGGLPVHSTTPPSEVAGILDQLRALSEQLARLVGGGAPKLAAEGEGDPCGGCCLDCTTGAPPGTLLNCDGEDGCEKVIPPDYFAILVRDPNRPGQQAYYERPANLPAAVIQEFVTAIVADPVARAVLVGAVLASLPPHTRV